MTTIHASIIDTERHEPKHASTATLNQVLKSNGDGTTFFGSVAYSELAAVPAPVGYQPELVSVSVVASQAPTTTNTPLQITFGNTATSADGKVTINSSGQITFNTTGYYAVDLYVQAGRTTSTGVANLFTRYLYNGAETFPAQCISMNAEIITVPYALNIKVKATAGDTLVFQVVRDSTGTNDGGLYQNVPATSGWQASPSAMVVISSNF